MIPASGRLLWPSWPELFKKGPDRRFIAQGTLINKQSIERTISRANLHGPVIAEGVRRIFNFALIDENYIDHGGRYERSSVESHRATLNIVPTGNRRDTVNGILFSTSPDDIDALAKREFGYDVLPTEYRQGDERATAYMFIARRSSAVIGHRVVDDILPNESAVSICLSGAATYGEGFLQDWIDSCYLADGRPLMDDPYCEGLVRRVLDAIACSDGSGTPAGHDPD
jgi:hypothetical protein